jgi:hypothetical protein
LRSRRGASCPEQAVVVPGAAVEDRLAAVAVDEDDDRVVADVGLRNPSGVAGPVDVAVGMVPVRGGPVLELIQLLGLVRLGGAEMVSVVATDRATRHHDPPYSSCRRHQTYGSPCGRPAGESSQCS